MTSSGKVARTTTQVQGEVGENSRLTRLASEMWDFATNSCLVGYLDGNKSACTCKHLIPRAPLVPCWRREPLRVCLKTSLEQEIYRLRDVTLGRKRALQVPGRLHLRPEANTSSLESSRVLPAWSLALPSGRPELHRAEIIPSYASCTSLHQVFSKEVLEVNVNVNVKLKVLFSSGICFWLDSVSASFWSSSWHLPYQRPLPPKPVIVLVS